MNRREFLELSSFTAVWYLIEELAPLKMMIAPDRLTRWAPNPIDLVEWRYAAGRIADETQDFGFVLSISNIEILETTTQQLLVQRKNFIGTQEFVKHVYDGTRFYDNASATYTFQDESNQEIARWQWDEANKVYQLSVTTPELTLDNILLKPQGDLIPEGVDGDIQGRIQGILIDSDYYADWAVIEIDGADKGVTRIDMQGLRPSSGPTTEATDLAHHWFALAVELDDGAPAWISAWRIEDAAGPFWGLTIARGRGNSWTIALALSEQHAPDPPEVDILSWQELPSEPGKYAGQTWRVRATNEAIDLVITVPAGQFISGAPLGSVGGVSQMQEAVGVEATGTVLGAAIRSTKVAIAESTADFYLNFMPVVRR